MMSLKNVYLLPKLLTARRSYALIPSDNEELSSVQLVPVVEPATTHVMGRDAVYWMSGQMTYPLSRNGVGNRI